MCGIALTLSSGSKIAFSTELLDRLQRRGPDHIGNLSLAYPRGSLSFISSVLSLRSEDLVRQPLKDPGTGSILCWNGEAWKLDDKAIDGNDTKVVLDLLVEATVSHDLLLPFGHDINIKEAIVNALRRISGPYAFIFFDARHSKVFYGRDPLGRRSLLRCKEPDGSLMLSSVSSSSLSGTWTEVEANGIYVISAESTDGFDPIESHIVWPVMADHASTVSKRAQTFVWKNTLTFSLSCAFLSTIHAQIHYRYLDSISVSRLLILS